MLIRHQASRCVRMSAYLHTIIVTSVPPIILYDYFFLNILIEVYMYQNVKSNETYQINMRKTDKKFITIHIIVGCAEAVYNSRGARHRTMLRDTALSAIQLLRPYVGCAVATCVLWIMFPLVYRLQGHQIEFHFWVPVNYNHPLIFPVVLLYSFYVTNLVAIGNPTMDAFIGTILNQCKTQLNILRMNFEDLPERAKALAVNSTTYEMALRKLFLDCIRHFEKISETMDQLLSVFGFAVLVQFAVGGWTVCMAAYKLVSVNVMSFDFASTTLFLICILIELFLYCYYGNEVTVESDRVVQSIYSMDWLHAPLSFKRSVVLTMERAKRPLRPTAGHLIPLSLDTFVTWCGGVRSSAGRSVVPHLHILRVCGFCRLRPHFDIHNGPPPRLLDRLMRRVHAIYCTCALIFTSIYLVQEFVYAYQVRNDMDKLAKVMFLLLCHITSITKQYVFYTDADRIDCMITDFDEQAYNCREPAARVLLEGTARSAARLVRVYSSTAIVTCVMWIIFPIIYYVRGYPVEFSFWINIDHSRAYMFVIILMYSFYVTTLVGVANTTMDAFMATVLYQCKTQLRILRLNFENLPERAKVIVNTNHEELYENVLMKLFLDCLDHYKRISESVTQLQNIFGVAIFIQFGIGGWILCMAAYKLVSSNRVIESIYSMDWLHAPLSFKRCIVLTMERAKRPLLPVAGHIIPLSLNTYVTKAVTSASIACRVKPGGARQQDTLKN
ncbi:unnamed protein product [Diatraea saccharalis]|uniref:Odorant receptor n=1 Tax=Diatraea saccharalis TaxID=40085 RepID=A0A9N9RGM0_9NEOP|nr:unnamed protein product [Diatraea saccharalis]